MIFEYTKHRIGQHFLPTLINDDATGLDSYEEVALNDWLATVGGPWTDADGHRWSFGHLSTLDNTEDEFAVCDVTNMRGATIDVLLNFYKEN